VCVTGGISGDVMRALAERYEQVDHTLDVHRRTLDVRQLEALVEPTEVAGVKSPRGVEDHPQTPEVDFYVRGEEYSSQLDTWLHRIADQTVSGTADFAESSITDEVLHAILISGNGNVQALDPSDETGDTDPDTTTGFWSWLRKRRKSRGTQAGRGR
jgi:hypothetical protein